MNSFTNTFKSISSSLTLTVCIISTLVVENGHAQSPLDSANPRSSFPASTYLIFRSSNVAASTTAIEDSEFGKRLSAEPWTTLAETHRNRNISSLLNTRPWMGIDWHDLKSVASEGYFVGFLDSQKRPHLAFLLQLGDKADSHPFVVTWKKTYSQKRPLKELSIKNVKLWMTSSVAADGPPAALAIGSQWTAISSSPTALTEWLSSQGTQTLAPNAVTEKVFKNPSSASTIQFWLKPWSLLRSYTETSEPKLFKSLSKYGVEQLTEVLGQIDFTTTPPAAWQIQAEVTWQQPLEKALAALSFVEGTEIVFPGLTLGQSATTRFDNLSVAFLDNKPWFQGASYLADLSIDEDTPGGFADILDSILTDPEGPKIDVRQEVIYKLGNPMVLGGATVNDPKRPNKVQRNILASFPFPDTTAMQDILQRMFEGDEEVTNQTIGDYRLWYTVHNESLFVSMSEGESKTITAAAVNKTHIFLATDTNWLKELINESIKTPAATDSAEQFEKPISFRQSFDLKSWLQFSWQRIPERTPSRKNYESTDLPALILTNALVPQMSNDQIPPWKQAKDLFGNVSIVGKKTATGVQLSIDWR